MNMRCWMGLLALAPFLLTGAPLVERDFSAAVREGELPAGVARIELAGGGACLELGAKAPGRGNRLQSGNTSTQYQYFSWCNTSRSCHKHWKVPGIKICGSQHCFISCNICLRT